jgi:hypothetical protein
MFSIFRKKKLDLSTPSSFEKSIIQADEESNDLFDQKIWRDISKKEDPRAYMEVIENLAHDGIANCQELVAQWNIIVFEGARDADTQKFGLRKAIKFGELAALSGVTREAANLPLSMLKLAGILTDENDGYFSDEIEELFNGAYKWYSNNSNNQLLPSSVRNSAKDMAKQLYEESPELYESSS